MQGIYASNQALLFDKHLEGEPFYMLEYRTLYNIGCLQTCYGQTTEYPQWSNHAESDHCVPCKPESPIRDPGTRCLECGYRSKQSPTEVSGNSNLPNYR